MQLHIVRRPNLVAAPLRHARAPFLREAGPSSQTVATYRRSPSCSKGFADRRATWLYSFLLWDWIHPALEMIRESGPAERLRCRKQWILFLPHVSPTSLARCTYPRRTSKCFTPL